MEIGMTQLREFVKLQEEKKRLDAELKMIKAAIGEMEPSILEYLQEGGIQNINVDKHTVYIARDIHASFLATDEAFKILEEQGMTDALTTTIHPSRASSIVREVVNGLGVDEDKPDWLDEAFSIYDGYKVSVRSGK